MARLRAEWVPSSEGRSPSEVLPDDTLYAAFHFFRQQAGEVEFVQVAMPAGGGSQPAVNLRVSRIDKRPGPEYHRAVPAQGAFDPAGFVAQPLAGDDQRMRVLLDKREIHDALMRYCRGCDRADENLLRSVVHPDAVFRRGDQTWEGPDAIVRDLVQRTRRADKSLHTVTNELIEVDGDTAQAEFYWIAYAVRNSDGRTFASENCGRYVDRWERRADGHWRIAHRLYLIEWSRADEVGETPAEIKRFGSGLQSRSDPSYLAVAAEPAPGGRAKLR